MKLFSRPFPKANLRKILVFSAIIGGSLLVLGAFFFTIALAWTSRDLPDPNSLMSREVPQSTRIYDRTGTHLLYEMHGDENRTLVQIKDLPTYVPNATVSIEDKNFYTHHGIDWIGLVRAFIKNVFTGQSIKGTSTLTQQFVKNAILTNERSLSRKFKEIVLSLQLERIYTKDQILQLYLNEIPYGSTIYGIESASENYFGKQAKDLTVDEAALLAAIPQAPDTYSPYGTGLHGDNRKTLVGRQQLIIGLLLDQGYITKEQADEAKTVDTLKKILPKKIANISAPHFVMYVRSLLIDKYGQTMVEQKGLKVITTLDWEKEQIAEEEVKNGVDARGKKYNFSNAALVALDPKTGQILSMVGSKNFFDIENDGQVNVTIRPRQPGSSFKPLVYAAGFMKGYTPETTLWDVNTTFKTDLKDYSPKNYDFKEHGPISARQALQGSLNISAVKMLYLTGISRVLDLADQLGYTTLGDRSRFGLSLVLGGGEVKLLEHANAYAAFANNGIQMPTSAILSVQDATGIMLDEWKPAEGKQVLDKDTTARLSNVLSDNNARTYVFGASNFLTLPKRPVAAKTGTTNNFHDAWTLGYTPSLVAGVWVGNNDNSEMKSGADGSQIAAPIWQAFMKRALVDQPAENFPAPPPTTATKPVLLGRDFEALVKIDKASGKLATEFTPPDMIEEKMFRVAHDTLYYVDKDDPQGPAPTNPADDPQFNNWENSVQDWVKRTGWNATSTAPTESDDIHTAASAPVVTIISPAANETITGRTTNVTVTISALRRITKVDALCEGLIIGSSQYEPWNVGIQFPNSLDRGFHDLVINAYDDVGNKGTATVTINLNADPSPLNVHITSPNNGATIVGSSFPVNVTVTTNELSQTKKVDLYLQTTNGSTQLISSTIAPTDPTISFVWKTPPDIGSYILFPVIIDQSDATHIGDPTRITITN